MKLWKSSLGYVNINIMGKYPEKLINRCTAAGVPLFAVQKQSSSAKLRMRARDVYRLRPLARGSGCRVRITRRGCPLRLKSRFSASVFFAASCLLFAAVFAVFASRVRFIEVSSEEVPREDILAALSALGIERGVHLKNVNTAEAAVTLASDTRIANAKVTLHGVVLSVEIAEIDRRPAPSPVTEGASVTAGKDCVISFISVEHGFPAVEKGRSVHSGDMLILGDPAATAQGASAPARGVVLGQTAYTVSASASPYIQGKVRGGSSAVSVAVVAFGRELCFEPPFPDYDREPLSVSRLFSAVPVTLICYRCYELIEQPVPDTENGVCLRAALSAQEKLSALLPEQAKIVSSATRYNKEPDGSVTATLSVTAIEPIGVPTD